MKSVRVTWGVLMAGSLLAGLYSGRREFFLLFFILAFVLLFSLALNLWTTLSFAYVQEPDSKAVVRGTRTGLRLGVVNDKPFPFTLMDLRVDTPDTEAPETLRFSLLPRSRQRWHLALPTPHRGIHRVGMGTLVVNDVLGLVRTRFDMRSLPYYRQPELKVYPRLVELPVLPARHADAKAQGAARLVLADDGEEYADLRAYRPGDPLKRVHRAATARLGRPMVKRYEVPMEAAVLVALDPAIGAGQGRAGLPMQDLACECAAAIAHYCLKGRNPVVLVAGERLEAAGLRQFERLYNHLAVMDFEEEPAFERRVLDSVETAARGAGRAQMLWLLSQKPPETLAGLLEQAAGHTEVRLVSLAPARAQSGPVPHRLPPGVSRLVLAPGDDLAAVLGGVRP